MGEIFLADAEPIKGVSRRCAIKIVLKEYSRRPEVVDLFKREAALAIQFTHSSVAAVYDFGIQQGQFYLAMEFVDGISLRALSEALSLFHNRLALEDSIYIAKEVCSGLDYVHRFVDPKTGTHAGVVHRDVSPQNIMINREGEVKIIDFGVAKSVSSPDKTNDNGLIGKIRYLSPEQAHGKRVSAQSDIFSLGIVLWELVAGERVYDDLTQAQLMSAVQNVAIKPFPPELKVPSEVVGIIEKATACDPAHRYKSAQEMFTDLTTFLNSYFPTHSHMAFRSRIRAYLPKPQVEPSHSTTVKQSEELKITSFREDSRATFRRDRAPYLGRGTVLLLGILLALGGVYYVRQRGVDIPVIKQLPQHAKEIIKEVRRLPEAGSEETVGEGLKSESWVVIEVSSSPVGAEIYMNRTSTGKRTPARINISGLKSTHLTLRLKGYEDCSALLNAQLGTYNCPMKRKR